MIARLPSNVMQVDGYQAGRVLHHRPGQELKAIDVTLAPLTSATTGTFLLLNAPVPGNDLFNRIGRKAYFKNVNFECYWKDSGAIATNEFLRLILFYDSQANAAAPVLADVLKNANAAAASTILSHVNLDNRERFKIIRNWRRAMPVTTAVNNVGANTLLSPGCDFAFNEFITLGEIETIYNVGTAGTVADVQSGALWLLLISEIDTGWTLAGNIRLRFYD